VRPIRLLRIRRPQAFHYPASRAATPWSKRYCGFLRRCGGHTSELEVDIHLRRRRRCAEILYRARLTSA